MRVVLRGRLQNWLPAFLAGVLCLYAIWPWTQWNKSSSRTIVFFGFSTVAEVLTQSIFPDFQQVWKEETGERVEFASSFSGSGTISSQLIMGVPAQLALLSLESDAQRLVRSGLTSADSWKRLPYNGVLNRTPLIILVRQGNPKRIHDFADLAGPGVRVVHPDPLTSGAATWAILAEYGAGMRQHPDQPQAGYKQLLSIWRNVVAQAHSARAARTQFENGFGDALITYEQEALWDQAHGRLHSEPVYPSHTILSEHILVILDRNIKADERRLVNAFLTYLWSERAQRLFVESGFRSVDESLNVSHPALGKIADPFLVSDLGGWRKAGDEIADRIWKGQVLKELGRNQ